MSVSTEDGEIAEYDYSHAPMFAIDCEMVRGGCVGWDGGGRVVGVVCWL